MFWNGVWNDTWWFQGWADIIRMCIITVIGYVYLVLLFRVYGKRTLAHMNRFDFIVNVAVGGLFSVCMTNPNITILQMLLGFSLLLGMQYLTTFFSVHSKKFALMVKGEPSVLFYRGAFQTEVMNQERVTRDEILEAVRDKGFADTKQVAAVVLENNGTFSVVGPDKLPDTGLEMRL